MKSLKERFEQYVSPEPNTGCWLWTASHYPNGYGSFWMKEDRKNYGAHRVAKFIYEGLPLNAQNRFMHIDHKCRNRLCVNPKHLELVTAKENCLRGMSPASIFSKRTHCSRGHELVRDNIIINASSVGKRKCRICNNEREKRIKIAKGIPIAVNNKDKTHCPKGHELSGDNLILEKKKSVLFARRCRICRNEWSNNRYHKRMNKNV